MRQCLTAYDSVTYQNNIFITESNSYDSYLLNLTDRKLNIIKKLDYTLNIKGNDFKNYYIASAYIGRIKYFILINLETSKILKKMPMTLGFGFVDFLISDNLIISANSDSLGLFTLDNEKIWAHNINDILIQEKKGKIKELKIYNNNLIIASNSGLISIAITTGRINWATSTYARTIEIVENRGYVCTSLSFFRINLDTGEMYDYDRENSRLPNFDYNGVNYWPSGHRVIYNEGLLWYAVYDSGQSFIIAINPQDGHYEWILNIKEANSIDDLKFHKNRMYIRDVNNNLFVYEKDIE
ncbi:hypothetical protein [Flavobacterium frigoris]|uniref:Uncharacterized protein n=1 Tax=Flavobacterium frigoris TaxID=229204 RepID=A0A1H9S510_FLAFI|nr:hypothetical protein [Flavobacterium frigoris]SER80077.1 hypothetical protein SAMN05444355_1443 [Flavobacterium frigoris]